MTCELRASFYVIQFASDAQNSFGSSRNAHESLRDARRDSSHLNIQVHVLIKKVFVNYYFFA